MLASDLLFDLDGTITDSRLGIVRSIQHGLRMVRGPRRSASQLERFVGPPLHDSFAEVLGTDDQRLIWQAVACYRERYARVGYTEANLHTGICAVLEELSSQGARLWVATAKPTIYAEKVIEHFSLGPLFAGILGSELSGQRSSKSDIVRDALSLWSIRPGEAVMIGDCRHDIEGARDNDVKGIGVLWGVGSRRELESVGADFIVKSPLELAEVLSNRKRAPG